MTPRQKADELIDIMSKQSYKYQPYAGARYITEEVGYEAGKKCALISVDEILKARTAGKTGVVLDRDYWEEVRTELNAL